MAQIVTITNPLTGQPAQVDQLDHTAQQIDDAIARAIPSTDHPGCYYRMIDGVVEWFNPPMKEGIKYRTTERHLGKPVYKKRFTINALPNNAQLIQENVINASTDSLFDLHITFVDTASGAVSSYPPFYESAVAARAWVRETGELVINTFADLSSTKAIVTLKYTKTIN